MTIRVVDRRDAQKRCLRLDEPPRPLPGVEQPEPALPRESGDRRAPLAAVERGRALGGRPLGVRDALEDGLAAVDRREHGAVGAADDEPDARRDRALGVDARRLGLRLVALCSDEAEALHATVRVGLAHERARTERRDDAVGGTGVETQRLDDLAVRERLVVEQHGVCAEDDARRSGRRERSRRDRGGARPLERADEARVRAVVVEVVDVIPGPRAAVDDLDPGLGRREDVAAIRRDRGRSADLAELDGRSVEQVEHPDGPLLVDRDELKRRLVDLSGPGHRSVSVACR
ncbi:hypothetical protein [Microbacterium sp. JZ37]|uniref:hypothetical protein n=1 Tax=Microbacterium sp. JZ37 TaxID=2654193 RepID=UPI002B4939A9|nr:hypothetical protein [Microbacterium sp. JZ37]